MVTVQEANRRRKEKEREALKRQKAQEEAARRRRQEADERRGSFESRDTRQAQIGGKEFAVPEREFERLRERGKLDPEQERKLLREEAVEREKGTRQTEVATFQSQAEDIETGLRERPEIVQEAGFEIRPERPSPSDALEQQRAEDERTAINLVRRARGEEEISQEEFLQVASRQDPQSKSAIGISSFIFTSKLFDRGVGRFIDLIGDAGLSKAKEGGTPSLALKSLADVDAFGVNLKGNSNEIVSAIEEIGTRASAINGVLQAGGSSPALTIKQYQQGFREIEAFERLLKDGSIQSKVIQASGDSIDMNEAIKTAKQDLLEGIADAREQLFRREFGEVDPVAIGLAMERVGAFQQEGVDQPFTPTFR